MLLFEMDLMMPSTMIPLILTISVSDSLPHLIIMLKSLFNILTANFLFALHLQCPSTKPKANL